VFPAEACKRETNKKISGDVPLSLDYQTNLLPAHLQGVLRYVALYRRKRTVSKEDQESANATYLWVSTTTVKVILSLWLPALSLAIRRDLGLLGTLRQGRSLVAVVVVNRVVYRGREGSLREMQ
jgi:hypothetical protein